MFGTMTDQFRQLTIYGKNLTDADSNLTTATK